MNLSIFILGGVILIASGVLQVVVRPRPERETAAGRYFNRAVLRAVLFVVVGLMAILVGAGVITIGNLPPGGRGAPPGGGERPAG